MKVFFIVLSVKVPTLCCSIKGYSSECRGPTYKAKSTNLSPGKMHFFEAASGTNFSSELFCENFLQTRGIKHFLIRLRQRLNEIVPNENFHMSDYNYFKLHLHLL